MPRDGDTRSVDSRPRFDAGMLYQTVDLDCGSMTDQVCRK